MDRLPEDIKRIVAGYMVPKEDIDSLMTLWKDPTHTDPKLHGLYWPGKSRDVSIVEAARCGNLALVEWLLTIPGKCLVPQQDHSDSDSDDSIVDNAKDVTIYAAIASGNIALVKFVMGWGGHLDGYAMGKATTLQMMHFLLGVGCRWGDAMAGFAGTGSLFLIKAAFALDCPLESEAMISAITNCPDLRIIQWLSDAGAENQYCNYLTAAAHIGSMPVFLFFEAKGVLPDCNTFHSAVIGKNIEILDRLVLLGCPMAEPDRCFKSACRGRDMTVLEWLLDHGMVPRAGMDIAAGSGDLHIMKWLHVNGCPMNSDWTVTGAVTHGSFRNLRWLLSHGCTLSPSAFHTALWTGGNPRMLQFLRRHGCPWDASTFTTAVGFRRMDIIKYLKRHGCPWDLSTYRQAVGWRYDEIAEWLAKHGCPTK